MASCTIAPDHLVVFTAAEELAAFLGQTRLKGRGQFQLDVVEDLLKELNRRLIPQISFSKTASEVIHFCGGDKKISPAQAPSFAIHLAPAAGHAGQTVSIAAAQPLVFSEGIEFYAPHIVRICPDTLIARQKARGSTASDESILVHGIAFGLHQALCNSTGMQHAKHVYLGPITPETRRTVMRAGYALESCLALASHAYGLMASDHKALDGADALFHLPPFTRALVTRLDDTFAITRPHDGVLHYFMDHVREKATALVANTDPQTLSFLLNQKATCTTPEALVKLVQNLHKSCPDRQRGVLGYLVTVDEAFLAKELGVLEILTATAKTNTAPTIQEKRASHLRLVAPATKETVLPPSPQQKPAGAEIIALPTAPRKRSRTDRAPADGPAEVVLIDSLHL